MKYADHDRSVPGGSAVFLTIIMHGEQQSMHVYPELFVFLFKTKKMKTSTTVRNNDEARQSTPIGQQYETRRIQKKIGTIVIINLTPRKNPSRSGESIQLDEDFPIVQRHQFIVEGEFTKHILLFVDIWRTRSFEEVSRTGRVSRYSDQTVFSSVPVHRLLFE